MYKSSSEFGIHTKLTTTPITALQYTDTDYHTNYWYMVRPVKIIESGCGTFYNPGLGIFVKGDFVLSAEAVTLNKVKVWPNPAKDRINISRLEGNTNITIIDVQGRSIAQSTTTTKAECSLDTSILASGMYFLHLENNGKVQVIKIVVR